MNPKQMEIIHESYETLIEHLNVNTDFDRSLFVCFLVFGCFFQVRVLIWWC